MSERKKFLFPMRVIPWTTLQTEDGQKLEPGPEMRAAGYIPVYENIQMLCEDFGRGVRYGTIEQMDDRDETE